LVDFDLEAPGLDTFDLLRPSEPTPGLVDFVTEYRDTRAVPDVTNFVYEPTHPNLDARVWVMPTGKQDGDYGSRLNAIDWSQLYAEQDGFLLFEDLKEQWARALSPDYVFIDSRTGHTDVGGICTRQLPDAVALFFFPNEQNRRGLEALVRDIDRESNESGRMIEKYFVAANVPDLDDEYGILGKEMAKFRQIMGHVPHGTIHHYDSLSLLQQTIFTIEHPRTKLAREYDGLAKTITEANLGDLAVVTEFLDTVVSQPRNRPPELVNERLKKIRGLYAKDGAILYALGQAHHSLGRDKEAQALLNDAARLGFQSEEKLLEGASKEYSRGAQDCARDLVRRALDVARNRVFAIVSVLSLVANRDVDFLSEGLRTVNARGLSVDEKLYIASGLEIQRKALPPIADFLRPLIVPEQPERPLAITELSLCLIGQRRFAEAEDIILSLGRPSELIIQDTFNYAMALWGRTKAVPQEAFSRVVELDRVSPRQQQNANYHQCLAIASWAVGDPESAREFARKSRKSIDTNAPLVFSAWRYLKAKKDEFLQDLEQLDAMISAGQGQPLILSDHD
jgi:tetratricopeptide (TPR) repeat protein